jgi:hypothetical protein
MTFPNLKTFENKKNACLERKTKGKSFILIDLVELRDLNVRE